MYCMKGSWAGQTFALANVNDSGPKKSRIRRSKEERKTMVQSFIKRYQSLNNGNFPSLNLTHKEVGGSFYTVREIVREIIQENRVLGPGQFSSEDQKDDVIAINYPLGTISSEPPTVNDVGGFSIEEGQESVVLSMNTMEHMDLDVVQYPTEHQLNVIGERDGNERLSVSKSENNLGSSEQEKESFNVDGDIKNAHAVNHIDTNEISDASNKLSMEGIRKNDTFGVDGESGQTGAFEAKLTLPTENVEVETFPLRPAVTESSDSDGTSTVSKNFDENSYNSEAEIVTLSNSIPAVNKVSSFDSSSDPVKNKVADSSEVVVLGGSSDLIKDAKVNQENSPLKDDIAVIHNLMSHIPPHGDSTAITVEQNNLKPTNASMGITNLENSDGTSCRNSEEPAIVNGNGIAFKKDERVGVGSSPLNRIDLESWRASKRETNPVLAFFRAFMDAFSKFWSE